MIRLKQKFDPSTYVSYAYTASLFAPFSLPLPGASADSTYPDSLAYLAYLKLPSFSVDREKRSGVKKGTKENKGVLGALFVTKSIAISARTQIKLIG